MIFAAKHWSPSLSPWFVRLMRPIRSWRYSRVVQLNPVEVQGERHVRDALQAGKRILIAPNHPSHADPFAIYEACAKAGSACHIMAAWHVFAKSSPVMQRWLQWHGCFSIDREAADLSAFRDAVDVLRNRREPLVIFPEGDIFHCNDRLTPFREGAFSIALAAAKRCEQEVVVIPAAIRYHCAEDPTPGIGAVLSQIETRLLWRPQTEKTLVDRIRSIGHAVLALKEQEFYGHSLRGPLPDRILQLADFILARHEATHCIDKADTIPKRVKDLRQRILSQLKDTSLEQAQEQRLRIHLDEVFLALQLFSYPGDYLDCEPVSIERIAETVDKFEEDVLQAKSATIRCRRDVQVCFGTPVPVVASKSREAAADLTRLIESRVTSLGTVHK